MRTILPLFIVTVNLCKHYSKVFVEMQLVFGYQYVTVSSKCLNCDFQSSATWYWYVVEMINHVCVVGECHVEGVIQASSS